MGHALRKLVGDSGALAQKSGSSCSGEGSPVSLCREWRRQLRCRRRRGGPMIQKLNILGLALAAIFAISAADASGASAVSLHSNSTSGSTFITGVQIGVNQMDLANGTPIKCVSAVFDASFAGTTASQLTVTPTYSGCTAAGQKIEVKLNGCDYLVTTPTKTAVDSYHAVVHLVCPAGKSVALDVPTAGCSVLLAAQTAGGVVDLTNVTSAEANKDDIVLISTLSTKYTTAGGGICGAGGTGSLTGESTYRAYSDAAHIVQSDLAIF
jgi:hypothetical protein